MKFLYGIIFFHSILGNCMEKPELAMISLKLEEEKCDIKSAARYTDDGERLLADFEKKFIFSFDALVENEQSIISQHCQSITDKFMRLKAIKRENRETFEFLKQKIMETLKSTEKPQNKLFDIKKMIENLKL